MSTITKALATGYRFQNFHDYPALAQETPAYSATLTHEGREVAQVTSDGGGGAALPRYVDAEAREAFQAAARALTDAPEALAEEELLGLLYEHAHLARAINREAAGRVVVQLDGDGEVWEGGPYRILPAGYSPASVRAELRQRYDGAKVWDQDAGDFTPA